MYLTIEIYTFEKMKLLDALISMKKKIIMMLSFIVSKVWFRAWHIAWMLIRYIVYIDSLFWRVVTHCKMVWVPLAFIPFSVSC